MLGINEKDFQQQVIDLAKLWGWLVHAERVGRTAKGWRTPIQGHKGFPDLVLCHEVTGQVIFAEIKSAKGRSTAEQKRWQMALDAFLWRPSDWLEIEEVLKGASDE